MLKNNRFSADTDAERWERLDLLAANIGDYAVELGVAGAKLQWAQGACAAWEKARTDAGVEHGEMEEAFQEFHQKLDAFAKAYSAAKELLLAVIWEYEKPDEIVEAYHIDGESPRDLKRLVAHVDWWKETHERLKAAGDLRIIADAIVAQLVALRNEAKTLWEFAITQKREKLDAFDKKELLFAQDNTKLAWLLAVCKLVWGDDDERLLELGFVPKSQIWTPGGQFNAPKMLMFDQMRTMFSWQSVTGATSYKLEVKNIATQEIFGNITPANKQYYELAKGSYSAKVCALKETDPQQVSAWSVEIAVVIEFAAPGNLKYNPGQKEFSWGVIAGATLYQLVQQGAPEDIYLGTDITFQHEFVGGGKFRVRAVNDETSSWGEWSAWLTVSA